MKIGDLLDGEYLLDSIVIISHVLEKDKAWVLSHLDDVAKPKNVEIIKRLLDLRRSGYPLAYITGYKEFMGLEIKVKEGVFIPRPETETLVEKALEIIEKKGIKVVGEVGTGSGAIAVSLAKYGKVRVLATDTSEEAVVLAKENAALHNVENLVEVRQGGFLEPFGGEFDRIELVVSNPPYIEPDYEFPKELLYEPREAFVYGKSSVDFFRDFYDLYKGKGWKILMEFSGKEEDKKILTEIFGEVHFIRDLDGTERFFICRV